MPHAQKLWLPLKFEQLLLTIIARQVDPADHSGNEWMLVGEAENPTIFVQIVLCLHENGLLNSGCVEMRL